MKKVENKTISIKGSEPTTYVQLAKVCLDVTPKDGFTTTEMKARLKISTALDKANGHIELEDADHAKLVQLVKDMKWGVSAQELINFEEDIVNAE